MRKEGEELVSRRLVFGLLSALCLLFTGCSTVSPQQSDFNFIFKYGAGAEPRNVLDTFSRTFTKDMVSEPAITINLALSPQELDKIYQDMQKIDLPDYPDVFSVIVPSGSIATMVTPNLRYYFKVSYDTQAKELSWDDKIRNDDAQATRLRQFFSSIVTLIESKEEVKEMPRPTSGYQ